jgi:hypothetical protein
MHYPHHSSRTHSNKVRAPLSVTAYQSIFLLTYKYSPKFWGEEMTLKRVEKFGGSFFFTVQNPSNLVWNVYMNSSYICNIFKFKNILIIDTYLLFSIEKLKKCERFLFFFSTSLPLKFFPLISSKLANKI